MNKYLKYAVFAVFLLFPFQVFSGASIDINETDRADRQLVGFFDLRERESYIQLTNIDSFGQQIHIQIFNVADNCNENNFFDNYTGNDTHVYNLRNIQTNDGSPSGIVLPDDAYGIIVATHTIEEPPVPVPQIAIFPFIGNLRILDITGYEYRTNLAGLGNSSDENEDGIYTFNYNNLGGITLSDVVGITLDNTRSFFFPAEVFAADVVNIWASFDIDIYNENEVPFSCRNVIFSCLDQDNPLLEAVLEDSGDASVASFEYGINNAITHSRGGELLCPGNTISDGMVRMTFINDGDASDAVFFAFAGLNNGNGRGSIDLMWSQNVFED